MYDAYNKVYAPKEEPKPETEASVEAVSYTHLRAHETEASAEEETSDEEESE